MTLTRPMVQRHKLVSRLLKEKIRLLLPILKTAVRLKTAVASEKPEVGGMRSEVARYVGQSLHFQHYTANLKPGPRTDTSYIILNIPFFNLLLKQELPREKL